MSGCLKKLPMSILKYFQNRRPKKLFSIHLTLVVFLTIQQNKEKCQANVRQGRSSKSALDILLFFCVPLKNFYAYLGSNLRYSEGIIQPSKIELSKMFLLQVTYLYVSCPNLSVALNCAMVNRLLVLWYGGIYFCGHRHVSQLFLLNQ